MGRPETTSIICKKNSKTFFPKELLSQNVPNVIFKHFSIFLHSHQCQFGNKKPDLLFCPYYVRIMYVRYLTGFDVPQNPIVRPFVLINIF